MINNIHLYVVTHKALTVSPPKTLQVIRADDARGDNVATKADYCELRAQYRVWKNVTFPSEDYVGFFHYRRYLDFSRQVFDCLSSEKRPVPYRLRRRPPQAEYAEEIIKEAIEGFDVIAPVFEYTGISVWERFRQRHSPCIEDLKLAYWVIREKYPEFLLSADRYLNGFGEYYGNIFVMRRALFDDYCTWLFDVLECVDSASKSNYPRKDGYLGERLFGIYFTWLQTRSNIRCGECPRLHFSCYDGISPRFLSMRMINAVFPPGSRRRSELVARVHK